MFEKFHKNNVKELVLYGFFGVITTIANILIYQGLLIYLDYKISNLIAIIGTKILAYIVNKKFVFQSKCNNAKELLFEMFRFIVTRGFTGIFDYFGLILLVEIFGFNQVYTKYFIQVIIIILNYIFGKRAVFTSKK